MITNPNSSGQGHDPDHVLNPYHALIVSYGFTYSHSTTIHYSGGGGYVHHTYALGERKVGVGKGRWDAEKSSASGHARGGMSLDTLRQYLTNLERRGELKPTTSMMNKIEAYTEAGHRAAKAQNENDAARAQHESDFMRRMLAFETDADKPAARAAYNEAYRKTRSIFFAHAMKYAKLP